MSDSKMGPVSTPSYEAGPGRLQKMKLASPSEHPKNSSLTFKIE